MTIPTISPATPPPLKRTYVYVDGFNLYFRALNRRNTTGLKWLNLETLCKSYLMNHDILKIKYFTASVSGRYEPDKPLLQQAYLRALRTLPTVEIIYGKYAFNEYKIKISRDAKILWEVPEEKRTDVNIGAHLINDAHLKRFDTAIIVSNDSDLAEVLRLGRDELGVSVGLLNPAEDFNNELLKYANQNELYKIRENAVRGAQFPDTFTDKKGSITKPATW